MAKLNAPLFSLGASGAIGKALVYFGWKGLNCVRSYVVPSNPKTALQTTQRGYLGDAVEAVHDAQALAANELGELDKTAYALLGSTRATPRTWFNEAIKLWIDVIVAGLTPIVYSDGRITDATANSINMAIQVNEETGSDLAAGKFYFGTSKTSLIHSVAATINAGVSARLEDEDCSAFLVAGTKYFWQFRPDAADPCEGAISGIYHFVAE